jgi:secreted Zn-dependent insulinase-like peptidase
MLCLFSLLTKHYLAETLYPATIAGLEITMSTTPRGILLHATGYNEKLHLLIDTVIKNMKMFEDLLEESAFETYKLQLKKNSYNTFIESHKLNKDLRIDLMEVHSRTCLGNNNNKINNYI